MTIIKCDRCGKEMNNQRDAVKMQVAYSEYNGDIYRYDLCKSCAESFKIWLFSEDDT